MKIVKGYAIGVIARREYAARTSCATTLIRSLLDDKPLPLQVAAMERGLDLFGGSQPLLDWIEHLLDSYSSTEEVVINRGLERVARHIAYARALDADRRVKKFLGGECLAHARADHERTGSTTSDTEVRD